MHAFLKFRNIRKYSVRISYTYIFFHTSKFNFILQYTNSLYSLLICVVLCLPSRRLFLSLSSSLSPPSLYVRSVCVINISRNDLYIYITRCSILLINIMRYHTCRIILYYTNEVLTSTKFNHVDTIQPMALLYKI